MKFIPSMIGSSSGRSIPLCCSKVNRNIISLNYFFITITTVCSKSLINMQPVHLTFGWPYV